MGFEDDPGHVVQVFGEERRIVREVSSKEPKEPKAKDVGCGAVGKGTLECCEHTAVGNVRAAAGALPLLELRIALGKTRSTKYSPLLEVHPVNDADFVAILQVCSDAGQIDS